MNKYLAVIAVNFLIKSKRGFLFQSNSIRHSEDIEVGKKFNISDNGVRRWCESFNLPRTKKEINSYSDQE